MENHNFQWENRLFLWPFSIANCWFTKGYCGWLRNPAPVGNYGELFETLHVFFKCKSWEYNGITHLLRIPSIHSGYLPGEHDEVDGRVV